MPLPEDVASNIIAELRAAGDCAIEKSEAVLSTDLPAIHFPAFNLPPGTENAKSVTEQVQGRWLANLVRDSIEACTHALQGLVLLASCRHESGIASLERGVGYRIKNIREVYDETIMDVVILSLDALENNDLPALREHRKINSGIYARIFAGMMWDSCAAPHMAESLAIFARVKDDVESEIESLGTPVTES